MFYINNKKYIIAGLIIVVALFWISGLIYATVQTSWSGSIYSTGNVACTIINKTCSSAQKANGSSSTCDTQSYGGTAQCSDNNAGTGVSWTGIYKTGNSACAEIGATCQSAYGNNGVALKDCSTSNAVGTVLCNNAIGSGYTWSGSYNTGNSVCASHSSACNTAYGNNGVSMACSYSNQVGTVLCVPTIGGSCSANNTSATVNSTSIIWTAVPSGGNGTYTYSWTGTDSLSGSSISISKIYSSVGTKTAAVTITSGSQSITINCSNNVVASAITAPGAPTGLSATATSSSNINLSWTAPASDGGIAITGYKIERSTDGVNWTTINSNTGNTNTTYSDSSLPTTSTAISLGDAIGSTATWLCAGGNCGASVSCTATRVGLINGACGYNTNYVTTPSTYDYAYTDDRYLGGTSSTDYCATGTPSDTPGFPAQGGSASWTCLGSGSGSASPSCIATRAIGSVDGQCGSADFSNYGLYPYPGGPDIFTDTELCSAGVVPTVTVTLDNTPGEIVPWTCVGQNGGNPASCSAMRDDGTCGLNTNNSTSYEYAYDDLGYKGGTSSTDYCATGTPSDTPGFPAQGGSASWTCLGSGSGRANTSCTATRATLGDFNAYCTSSPDPAQIGETVSRTAGQNGGSAPYTYSWSGTDNLSGTSLTVSKAYSTAGTKLGQVLVTDKNGLKATGNCSVTIAAKPTVDNLPYSITNCGTPNASEITFKWKYNGALDQTGSEIQISDTNDFSTLNTTVSSSTNCGTSLCIQSVYVTPNATIADDPPAISFSAKPYYWRVKVSSVAGDSEWYYGGGTTTKPGASFATALHAYPFPIILPENLTPSVRQQVCLQGRTSGCYGVPGTCTYLWDATSDQEYFSTGIATNVSDPTCHAYTTPAQHTEKLTVCDPSLNTDPNGGGCCTVTKKFQVKNPSNIPLWKEVSPF